MIDKEEKDKLRKMLMEMINSFSCSSVDIPVADNYATYIKTRKHGIIADGYGQSNVDEIPLHELMYWLVHGSLDPSDAANKLRNRNRYFRAMRRSFRTLHFTE